MEGRLIVIRSSEDLTSIDGDILNDLSYGVDIHILSTNHMVCEGDNVIFTNYIHNNDPTVRVIFIPDCMINEVTIMEDTYYTESRLSMDPLDRFKWYCPLCRRGFDTT